MRWSTALSSVLAPSVARYRLALARNPVALSRA